MTLSLNDRALALADRLADDAEALRVAVTTLSNGTRVIDCGAQAAGGFEAGRALRRDLHGRARDPSPTRRWSSTAAGCPALTVTTDRPAVACLAAQYAGWRLDHEGYFAMGSGPGRALIRAEDLYDDLDWDEHASAAVLCLETREPPPAEVADFVAQRAGVRALGADPADGADGERGRRRADRGAGRRDRAAQAPRARLRRAARRRRLRQLPAAAGGGRRHGGARAHQRRRALRRPGPPHRRGRDDDDALRDLVERLPASASSDYGEPFGKVLKDANFDFYKIDPLLFSPAQIRLTSVASGRSFEAGAVNLEVLERSFWG